MGQWQGSLHRSLDPSENPFLFWAPLDASSFFGWGSTLKWGIYCLHESKEAHDKSFFGCRNGDFNLRRDTFDITQTTACLETSLRWKAPEFLWDSSPSRQVSYQVAGIVSTSSLPSPVSIIPPIYWTSVRSCGRDPDSIGTVAWVFSDTCANAP